MGFRNSLICILLSTLFSTSLTAGGICIYEISSADTRLGSAGWAARAQDPSTLFTNPAGMSRFCNRAIEMGGQPIYNHVRFKSNSNPTVSGPDGLANLWLPAGSFFYLQPLNERFTVGFGNFGYFGSDLVYNRHSWVGRYYLQKVLLEAISFVPAASYRINECLSIGAGLNVMYGFMKQRSAVNNVIDGIGDGYFTLSDYRFAYGGVFGVLYEPNACTRFGVQYLTKVRIDFRAKPRFRNLGSVLSQILSVVGIIGSKLDLHVNVPQSVMFSAYRDLTPTFTIMADAGWQQWSAFENVIITLADTDQTSFRFRPKYLDTWHLATGVEWRLCEYLTLSGGAAYDSSAVSTKERTLNFPVGAQWRFGTGLRWQLGDGLVLDLSSSILWQGKLKCRQNRGPLAGEIEGYFHNAYGLFFASNISWAF